MVCNNLSALHLRPVQSHGPPPAAEDMKFFIKTTYLTSAKPMKTLFSFLTLLCFFSTGYSQAYTPFPEANAVWTDQLRTCYDGGIPFSLYVGEERIYIHGDTVIGGLTDHQLAVQQISGQGSCGFNVVDGRYEDHLMYIDTLLLGWRGYLRQDTALRRVYYLATDTLAERILYDFNLTVGDTVTRFFKYNGVISYDTAW